MKNTHQAEPGRFTDRSLCPPSSGAALEPFRRRLDGLGAQARQAARAKSPDPGSARPSPWAVARWIPQSSFPIREGDLSFLQRVRYVITLDADTILPRDAARELIAVLAHPLNRARLKPVRCG